MQDLLAAERQELPRELRRATAGRLNATEVFAERRILGQLAKRELREAVDHGQHVVEVVREAGGQAADALHLLRLSRLLFRRLPIGHVTGHANDALHVPLTVPDRECAFADPAHGAVRTQNAVFLIVLAAQLIGQCRADDALAIVGVDRVGPAARRRVDAGTRTSPHRFVGGADIQELRLARVGDPEHFLDGLGKLAKALLARAQGAFGGAAAFILPLRLEAE